VSDSTLVRVPVTYLISVAATTATAPTTSASALDEDFSELGLAGSAGLIVTPERSTKDITDLVGDVVRTVTTDGKVTFKFVLIETSPGTLETYWGATAQDVTAIDGRLDIDPKATGGRKSWVFDFADDGGEADRYYIAEGEVTAREAVNHVGGTETAYGVTVTAYPVNGIAVKRWSTSLKTPA
jgi:hypothetical protein